MENTPNKKIVPSAKTLINTIVCSDDIRDAARKLNVETAKIYNVLSGNNKRDQLIVFKAITRSIASRLKKEQKILEKIKFI